MANPCVTLILKELNINPNSDCGYISEEELKVIEKWFNLVEKTVTMAFELKHSDLMLEKTEKDLFEHESLKLTSAQPSAVENKATLTSASSNTNECLSSHNKIAHDHQNPTP